MGSNRNRGYEQELHPEYGKPKRCGRNRAGFVMLLIAFAMTVSLFSARAEAASATLSVSAVSAKVGETVNVTVTAKSGDYIGYVYVILSYDATILQAPSSDSVSGGSGTITFIIGSDTADVKEASTTIAFTALKAGTSSLTIDSGTWGIDNNGDSLSLSTTNSSVKVTAASTASTDATLSSLKITGTTGSGASSTITLSPSFSKNTTSYTATVESNITTAVTTAKANDSKATVSISDASLSLKTGSNTVTVKVTAESGATKTYTVTIKKKKAETTTQEQTTTEETTTEPATEEETPEETTEEVEPITVTVDGQTRILLREFDESLLPEGFEMTEITWEEEVIQAGQGIYKNLTLVCTADIDGENPQIYILQEDGSLHILRNYQTSAVLYTILELPGNEAPEGFQAAMLALQTDYASEDQVEAWQSIASPDYYLLYVMNWDGESGYYLYDSLEGTFQRYDAELAADENETADADTEETTAQEQSSQATATDATPTDSAPGNDSGSESSSGLWKYIVMLAEAAVILCLAVMLILAKRGGGNPSGDKTGAEKTDGDKMNGGGAVGDAFDGAGPDGSDESEPRYGEENQAEKMSSDAENFDGENFDGGEGTAAGEDNSDEDAMSLNEYFSEFDALLDELEKNDGNRN